MLFLLLLEVRGEAFRDFRELTFGITNCAEVAGAPVPEHRLLESAGGGTSLVEGVPDDGVRGSAARGGMNCPLLFKFCNVSNTFGPRGCATRGVDWDG